jgi:hypothetical protein
LLELTEYELFKCIQLWKDAKSYIQNEETNQQVVVSKSSLIANTLFVNNTTKNELKSGVFSSEYIDLLQSVVESQQNITSGEDSENSDIDESISNKLLEGPNTIESLNSLLSKLETQKNTVMLEKGKNTRNSQNIQKVKEFKKEAEAFFKKSNHILKFKLDGQVSYKQVFPTSQSRDYESNLEATPLVISVSSTNKADDLDEDTRFIKSVTDDLKFNMNQNEFETFYQAYNISWKPIYEGETKRRRQKIEAMERNLKTNFIYALVAIFGEMKKTIQVDEDYNDVFEWNSKQAWDVFFQEYKKPEELVNKANEKKLLSTTKSIVNYVNKKFIAHLNLTETKESIREYDNLILKRIYEIFLSLPHLRTKLHGVLQNELKFKSAQLMTNNVVSESEINNNQFDTKFKRMKVYKENQDTRNTKGITRNSEIKSDTALEAFLKKNLGKETALTFGQVREKIDGEEKLTGEEKEFLMQLYRQVQKSLELEFPNNYIYHREYDLNDSIHERLEELKNTVDPHEKNEIETLKHFILSGKATLKRSRCDEIKKYQVHYIVLITMLLKNITAEHLSKSFDVTKYKDNFNIFMKSKDCDSRQTFETGERISDQTVDIPIPMDEVEESMLTVRNSEEEGEL